jgi:hypothetical protein
MQTVRRFGFQLAAAMLLAGVVVPAEAQVVSCAVSSPPAALARLEGNTELLSDLVLSCTGGTPTGAGLVVPQINITVILNTNETSRVTASSATSVSFSEALLLMDEPNSGNPTGGTTTRRFAEFSTPLECPSCVPASRLPALCRSGSTRSAFRYAWRSWDRSPRGFQAAAFRFS